MSRITILIMCSLLLAGSAISFAGETTKATGRQTLIAPIPPAVVNNPLVVIYTLSTCSHCRDAKEYLKKNNISFVDREIDSDQEHMASLMNIYDSMGVPVQNRGVPLFVIGNRIRIQGFNEGKLQKALKEVASKTR